MTNILTIEDETEFEYSNEGDELPELDRFIPSDVWGIKAITSDILDFKSPISSSRCCIIAENAEQIGNMNIELFHKHDWEKNSCECCVFFSSSESDLI